MLETMKRLLRERAFCALATCSSDRPHCSLMSYAFDEARMEIYLVTRGDSRKFANLAANPFVSLLVDSRSDHSGGPRTAAMALTISGRAGAFADAAHKESARKALLSRHPGLEVFFDDTAAEIISVKIDRLQLLDGLTESHFVDLAGDRKEQVR